MTVFDYAVITIAVLSVLLGWWRGFVYELLSLLGWVAAYLLARWFSSDLAALLPAAVGTDSTRTTLAFALLFVATLIGSSIVAWLLSKLIKLAGIGWLDGLSGAVFGMLRGVLLVLVLVLLAGMTGLPQQPFWRDAWLSRPLENMALAGLTWLPDSVAQRVHYGIKN